MAWHQAPNKDRRIQKTKKLLHEALGELIREKPFDEIVVQEILDRANVGRSTFYTHFSDKDELLVSVIHDLIGSVQMSAVMPSTAKSFESIISFSLPVFDHIYLHRRMGAAIMAAHGRAIVHERLQKIVAKRIAGNMKDLVQRKLITAGKIPPELLAQHIAATFVLVLNWWTESRSPLPAKEANELFRALIIPTLAAAIE